MATPGITQAMIEGNDEYTLLSLVRRGFMEKLTRLAVAFATHPFAK